MKPEDRHIAAFFMALTAAWVWAFSAFGESRVEWPSHWDRGNPAWVELRETEGAVAQLVFHNRMVHAGDVDFVLDLGDLVVDVHLSFNVDKTGSEMLTIVPRGPYIAIPAELTVREDATGEALIYPAMM